MKTLKITENNKLIAEFMELPAIRHHESNKENMYSWLDEISGTTFLLPPSKMNYERSWDWLMPVVEKIYETGISGGMMDDYQSALCSAEIDRVYSEVVKFIKWYNENK